MNTRREFLSSLGLAAAGPAAFDGLTDRLPPATTTGWGPPGSRNEIIVGGDVQYLCDDFLLTAGSAQAKDYPTGIRFSAGPARKDESPVLLPGVDAPWEKTGMYWVCVLYDGGRFRCWYNSSMYLPRRPEFPHQRPVDARTVVQMLVAYAESDDGIHWRKPKLNLVDVAGSTEHNICFLGDVDRYTEGCCVFIDSASAPEERYKMVYAGPLGLRGAVSPDGLSWRQVKGIFEVRGLDTQNTACYDSTLGRYVAYVRSNSLRYGGGMPGGFAVSPARRGRSVARMESVDFRTWSTPEIVLAPDILDGLDCDFYNCPHSRYGNLHLMLFSAYYHWSGKLNLQLAVSRDNREWVRPIRATLVDNGPAGSYDEFRIYAGPGILPAGADRVAVFTRSGQGPHPGSIDRGYNPGRWKSWPGLPEGCMGRITFGRDRLVGLEAGSSSGNFATRTLVFTGKQLHLNAEPTGPSGELSVQLVTGEGAGTVPVPGHTFADCSPVSSNSLDAVVRWTSGSDVSRLSGKPVRLHFRMKEMRLYSLQFTA